jgi:hypothetical protein
MVAAAFSIACKLRAQLGDLVRVVRGKHNHRASRATRRRLAGFCFDLTPTRSHSIAVFDRRIVRRAGILFLAASLVVIWPGAGIAHWPGSVDSAADTGTGYASLTFDGELQLSAEPCEPDGSERSCSEFPVDQDDLPRLDIGTGSIEIRTWINIPGPGGDSQRVGFMYEVTEGVAEITVTAGGVATPVPDEGLGLHTWLVEGCQHNGDGIATCTDDATPIDSVNLCLTVETAGSCPAPQLASAEVRNEGSVPLTVDLLLENLIVSAPADGFCELPRLEVSLAIGDPSDILHVADPCDVGDIPSFPLGVLDPGATVGVHLAGELLPDADPAHNGTTVEFDLRFDGTLWNAPAWTTTAIGSASVTIDGIASPAPDAAPESTEQVDPAPPEVAPPPTAEPPSAKPPAVEPPVKPPEQEPAPPAPPDEEPPTPEPPTEPEPVPPPADPVPEPPPVEPPPIEPPPADPVPEPPPVEPPPVEPPPVEPPPVEPPPEEPAPPEDPAPPATPAIGFVHLAGHDERMEGSAAPSGVGDLRAVMLVNVAEWASGDEQILLSHWGSAVEDRSFLIRLTADGELALDVHDGGFVSFVTDALDYGDGEWLWLQVSLDATLGNDRSRVEVFSSGDAPTIDVADISWGEPDYSVTKDRTAARHPAPNRTFKIGGHGTHAPAAMDIALIALRAERRSGQSELVFASDWRADGAFTGNPPSRPDDAAPEIEWTLLGSDVEHVPSALGFIDWLPTIALTTAPALTTSVRKQRKTPQIENSAGNPGIAGDANAGGGDPGTLR